MKALWYTIIDKETGSMIRDSAGQYHILPNKELLLNECSDWLKEHDNYGIKEIEQPIKRET